MVERRKKDSEFTHRSREGEGDVPGEVENEIKDMWE